LVYQGHLEHILVCDAGDAGTSALCRTWLAAHPELDAQLVLVPDPDIPIATKIEKVHAALPYATGDILAFVDDDILLRPSAVDRLVRQLQDKHAGSVFGLAAYSNWSNVPSSLLSAFVNANALLTYLPLTYLAEPYTITGHFYALRRSVFDAVGGLNAMDGRFDDDHELARRLQRHGLANVQTSVIYDVDNYLSTFNDYTNQMRRWFVIPRQTMTPYLTPHQQVVSLLGSLGNLIPPILALLTVLGRTPLAPLAATTALFAAVYAWCERAYLGRATPFVRWPWVLCSAFVAPLQALAGLLGGDTFIWRGRRIRLHRGGQFDVLG
jgi:ceramide glucosyltransferase